MTSTQMRRAEFAATYCCGLTSRYLTVPELAAVITLLRGGWTHYWIARAIDVPMSTIQGVARRLREAGELV